jgi:hypothetical protein
MRAMVAFVADAEQVHASQALVFLEECLDSDPMHQRFYLEAELIPASPESESPTSAPGPGTRSYGTGPRPTPRRRRRGGGEISESPAGPD